jgi:LysR family transcriptional regulator, low CO2-responsive transcriptional regulator
MYYSQFRAFHAVAIHGGFSKAAGKMGLTQPAVSDQVKKLEERFDVLLFNRHKRSVNITPLGEELLEITRRQFEFEKQAIDLLSKNQNLEKGSLRIAADSPLHVISLISRFKASYPGITVNLSIGNSDDILERLGNFSADIGVLANIPDDNRYSVLKLREDPLIAFVAKQHPFSEHSTISLKQLAKASLILREKGSSTRALIETEFDKAGLPLKVAMEVEGRESAREAVAANLGVGLVSKAEFGFDTRFVPITLSDSKAKMTESLLCLKEKTDLKHIKAFLKICAQK